MAVPARRRERSGDRRRVGRAGLRPLVRPAGGRRAGRSGRALAALVETVGPAHVLGFSWGGTLVLELWRQRPDLVESLVLADTYAGWRGSLPAEEVEARVASITAALDVRAPGSGAGPVSPVHRRPEAVALLAEMAADVRPATLRRSLAVDGGRRPVRPYCPRSTYRRCSCGASETSVHRCRWPGTLRRPSRVPGCGSSPARATLRTSSNRRPSRPLVRDWVTTR